MQVPEILTVIAPVVQTCGLEVDRIDIRPAGRRKLVQIFLDGDGAQGRGPSLDEISDATRAISKALDESELVGNQPYTLEVSSRGVNQALTHPKHYRRNVGRLVEISYQPETGAKSMIGRIKAVSDEMVSLAHEGTTVDIAYEQIAKAVIKVELTKPDEE
ncbi:MAG: ribosome maturation factor RimP [Propionibacteriaceae bacterium]|nr:ribosome maturation factor RimP [Propionibacteriaceae bacterium]